MELKINIFALDRDPYVAASYHCDRHVVKMIVEYAQLLSTAHRQLDGTAAFVDWENRTRTVDESGKVLFDGGVKKHKPMLILEGETPYVDFDTETYGDDGNNTITVTTGTANLIGRLCYNCSKAFFASTKNAIRKFTPPKNSWRFFLQAPKRIPQGVMTPFALAMPDEYKVDDEILSYQNYYVGDKARFAKWTEPATVPKWFSRRVQDDESSFQRPSRVRS